MTPTGSLRRLNPDPHDRAMPARANAAGAQCSQPAPGSPRQVNPAAEVPGNSPPEPCVYTLNWVCAAFGKWKMVRLQMGKWDSLTRPTGVLLKKRNSHKGNERSAEKRAVPQENHRRKAEIRSLPGP